MLKPGWLNRQMEKVTKEVESWPQWMRREAGLETATLKSSQIKSVASSGSTNEKKAK